MNLKQESFKLILSYNIYSMEKTMKYTKQLRWLAFLLIPFVALLGIHLTIPLQLSINSYALLENIYESTQISMKRQEIKTSTISLITTIQNTLVKYKHNLLLLSSTINKNSFKNMELNLQNRIINNSYQFSSALQKNKLNKTTFINHFMWFSPGIQTENGLSVSLRQNYNQILRSQPFAQSLLSERDQNIFSLSHKVSIGSQSIIFEYPTRYQNQYLNLNATIDDGNYSQQYQKTNDYQRAFLDYSDTENISLLALCIYKTANATSTTTCLRLRLQFLVDIIRNNWEEDKQSPINQTIIIVTNNEIFTSINNPQIIIQAINRSIFSQPSNSYFNNSEYELDDQLFNSLPNNYNKNIFIKVDDPNTCYVAPIRLGSINNYADLHFILVRETTNIIHQSSFSNFNLNSLLLPIILLTMVALCVISFILKNLLNYMDKQLFQLNHSCQFIVEGDINIEIPLYHKSQDIKKVYDKVRIINKLHRYSTQTYFTGHFSQKIFKYVEALQFLKNLNYDTGNVLENMGQAYTYIQEWEKARLALKESVQMSLKQIETQFGTLDEMMVMKANKKTSMRYKQLQIILIRRLFKLNFLFLKYLQLKQIFSKTDQLQLLKAEEFQKKQQQLRNQSAHYLIVQKKAFFPDFSSYSQCIIMLFYEAKQQLSFKNIPKAKAQIQKATRYLGIYKSQYLNTTKLLKEKGSKNRFFHKKNKLTAHSRTNSDILDTFGNIFLSKILQAQSRSPLRYIEALNVVLDGLKKGHITASIAFLAVSEVRKILLQLKYDTVKFESTQIFEQSNPFKCLYYGQITKQIEPQLYKFPTKVSPGLEREYVLLFDTNKDYDSNHQKLIQYHKERNNYIYEKFIRGTDRISIIKYNTNLGIQVQCNLLLKQSNTITLKKTIDEAIVERNGKHSIVNELFEALEKSINRIKNLKSRKVIIIYLRSLNHYTQLQKKKNKRRKSNRYSSHRNTKYSMTSVEHESPENCFLGDHIVSLMQQEGLRNMKLIFFCSESDSLSKVINYFGLNDINRRIWQQTEGINIWNNVVYVIEEKHRLDLDRILMLKAQDIPDNNVFIL